MGRQLQRRHPQPDRCGQRRGHRHDRARCGPRRASQLAGVTSGSATRADDRVLRVDPQSDQVDRLDRRRHRADRDDGRLRLGMGNEQPGRDGLADRPADQHRRRDDRGRQRRRSNRGSAGTRCGSPTSTPAPSRRSIRSPTRLRARSPSGTVPMGWRSRATCYGSASRPAPTPHRGGTLTIWSQVWVDTFDPVLTQIVGGASAIDLRRPDRIPASRWQRLGASWCPTSRSLCHPRPTAAPRTRFSCDAGSATQTASWSAPRTFAVRSSATSS